MSFRKFLNREVGKKILGETLDAAVEGASKAAGGFFGFLSYNLGFNRILQGPSGNVLKDIVETPVSSLLYTSGEKVINFATKLVEENKDGNLLNAYRLSTLGKTLIFGSAIVPAISQINEYNDRKQIGQVYPERVRPPIMYSDYSEITAEKTGASGDLVFALNNLRHGS